MKKFFIVALILTGVLLYSCSKNSSTPYPEGIGGTWRYAGFSGGLAGFRFTPVDTIDNYLQLDTANSRIMITDGSGYQACSGYTFEKGADGNWGVLTLTDSITYTNKFTVALFHDTLTLYPYNFVDAFTSYFTPSSKHFNWCNPAGH
ncbi:MAG TPA: hypothetical protein VG738_10790 [Chitinophagaceae bacterium]|nr:hypothetical protein [Chitinophagaceae bacterium]